MRRLEERQVPLTVGCPREPSPRLVLDEGCHVLFTDRESKHRVQCVGGLMCYFLREDTPQLWICIWVHARMQQDNAKGIGGEQQRLSKIEQPENDLLSQLKQRYSSRR